MSLLSITVFPKLLFDMVPQMFYWVEIWGLRGPFHDCESMVIEPSFGLFAGVLWVIVLLEKDIGWGFMVMGEGSLDSSSRI